MNEIVSKFLLAGDKFIPEMYFRQPDLHIVLVVQLLKIKKEYKETGDSKYVYQNKLDKACFQRDIAYGNFKDLNRRTAADEVLRDKALSINRNPKYDGYQRGLASMVYKFLIKKPLVVVLKMKIFLINN